MKTITFKKDFSDIVSEIKANLNSYQSSAEKRINSFEVEYNVNLPELFRSYLLELETIVSYYIEVNGEDAFVYEYVEIIDFPIGRVFKKGDQVGFNITNLYSIYTNTTYNAIDVFKSEGELKYLPIADNGSGDNIFIKIVGEDKGMIYRFNHELPQNGFVKIADNITDLFSNTVE